MDEMNKVTGELLKEVSDWTDDSTKSAYNIRQDGGCAGRRSTDKIKIESKTDNPGITIYSSGKTAGESVYIPACITHAGVDDLVYNDFYVEDGADVIIIAGCGVHSDGEEEAHHNGIHRFFIGKNANVVYREKHLGSGKGRGQKNINPVTDCKIGENAYMEMDTAQIGGVTKSERKTVATLEAGARLVIRERLLTDNSESAKSFYDISLDGEDSGVDLVSRSVAKGDSVQGYHSIIKGNCKCTGHSECDAILADNGKVTAIPELYAGDLDASLIHEAAIGKIAGEQIIKLRTLGLTEEEAERKIIDGFLR